MLVFQSVDGCPERTIENAGGPSPREMELRLVLTRRTQCAVLSAGNGSAVLGGRWRAAETTHREGQELKGRDASVTKDSGSYATAYGASGRKENVEKALLQPVEARPYDRECLEELGIAHNREMFSFHLDTQYEAVLHSFREAAVSGRISYCIPLLGGLISERSLP